jgi:hypothetical protein
MSRLLGPGVATSTGLYARCGDGWRQLQPTRTPLGVALAELLASGVEPCPVCLRYACDCDEWHEIMFTDPTDPDPHGDLRALQAMEIPL